MRMASFSYPILAPEGRIHLVIAVLCGVAATWLFGYWSIIVWLLIAFVFQFFRDPKRRISDQPGAIVSPASGKIVAVGEIDNPYLEATQVAQNQHIYEHFLGALKPDSDRRSRPTMLVLPRQVF